MPRKEDQTDGNRRRIVNADRDIDFVLAGYRDPVGELFRRYQDADGEDRDVLVLALIGRVMIQRGRKAG